MEVLKLEHLPWDIDSRWTTETDLGVRTEDYTSSSRSKYQVEAEKLLGPIDGVLPDFDKGQITRILCTIGLVVSIVASLGCMISSGIILHNAKGEVFQVTSFSTAGAEALSFFINVLVALVTDAMGYIHGTSLRWALYREGRLNFNTNIRLFTSARNNAPNRWPSNVVCIISLVLCYAATSQLLIRVQEVTIMPGVDVSDNGLYNGPTKDIILLNGVALCALGSGLLGQAVISSWAMLSSNTKIATWGSSPLNNTLALLHHNLQRQPGRCMMSVHQIAQNTQPSHPLSKQSSVAKGNPSVTPIVIILWLIAQIALAWAITILLVSRHSVKLYDGNWYLTNSWYRILDRERGLITNAVTLYLSPSLNNYNFQRGYSIAAQVVLGLLFTFAVQGAQTIGLHCVELMVNMARDEDEWRNAHLRRKGAHLSSNGFTAAINSWQNGVLFISKAALHWLLGQSLDTTITGEYGFTMVYMRIFVYAIVAFCLATFGTYLAYRRPSGLQPTAWGHFQTLADLVDDWNVRNQGLLWWGDKGVAVDGVRHAGTSGKQASLSEIRTDALYAGYGMSN